MVLVLKDVIVQRMRKAYIRKKYIIHSIKLYVIHQFSSVHIMCQVLGGRPGALRAQLKK